MRRIEIFGIPVHSVTMGETIDFICGRLDRNCFTQHCVVNVAKLVNMRKDPELDASVRECDIINIDGMGVVLGARMLGHDVPQRVAGVDLFHELLAMSAQKGYSVFLLGAQDEVVSEVTNSVFAWLLLREKLRFKRKA
jgi:N-acetylglucosaminyldiphosphoundecaprenol N-acetyl-beta-D-mannosaminyltransferase